METIFEIDEIVSCGELRDRIRSMQFEIKLDSNLHADLLEGRYAPLSDILLPREEEEPARPPPWAVGLSKQFKKDIDGLDRKLQGRILEILAKLSGYSFPFHPEGDTFRPLLGELAGCWRYRIGDNRLILQPRFEYGQLNALTFGARGSVYE